MDHLCFRVEESVKISACNACTDDRYVQGSEMINLDRRKELLASMGRFSFSELNDIFNSISASVLYLEQNVNMRLLLHNLRMELWKV